MPTYIPSALEILPHGSGFSFNDKGRLRVQSFNRRSPKSIQFYEPIQDIAVIKWIDKNLFYFMGKDAKHYSIFQAHINGTVDPILKNTTTDYMHPQKIDDQLFFIARREHEYTISHAPYPHIIDEIGDATNDETRFQERVEALMKEALHEKKAVIGDEQIVTLVDLKNKPAAFLTMVDDTQGFFVEYPSSIDRSQPLVSFKYHMLSKKQDSWQTEDLFSFSLPAHFFLTTNEFRLYESILPLLPRRIDNKLYFMHCDNEADLKTSIYKYDLSTRSIDAASCQPENVACAFFSPIKVNSMIFYGGTLSSDPQDHHVPRIRINNAGLMCVDLPFIFQDLDSPHVQALLG